MKKQIWIDGLKDAENLHITHKYTVAQLKAYLNVEDSVIMNDYRWNTWKDGFSDYISNLEFRLGWKECIVGDVTNVQNLMSVGESKLINR